MSESVIEKLKQRRRARGTVAPSPHTEGRQPLLAAHSEGIRAQLQAKPDTTLAELRDGLGLSITLSTLWYHLVRLGLTFKKTLTAAEQARPDVSLERACWQARQPLGDRARLVFVDETGLHPAMVREWGWGPRGERVRGTVPPSHWQTATRVLAVREAIAACGATLQPLPPSSPDLNPIEQVFAKLKAKRRAAGKRTVDALWKTLGQVLDDFPPAECANILRGAGYPIQAN